MPPTWTFLRNLPTRSPSATLRDLARALRCRPVLLAAVTDLEQEVCGESPSAACGWVLERTDNELFARAADWLIARPFRIALILLLAMIATRLIRRAVLRFVTGVERAAAGRSGTPSQLGERAHQRAETIGVVLLSFARAVVFVVAALMVLAELSLNLGPLLAGAGIVGVAVGFGAQTLVRDFLSGLFMLIEDQYGVGDTIDAGEAVGVVEGISLRTTRLRDVEGVVWHVPNGEIKRVANKSQDWARAVLDVQVIHGTDLGAAQEVLREVAERVATDPLWSPVILGQPEVLGVEQVTPGGITLRVVVRTRPADHLPVLRALRQQAAAALADAGIRVPVAAPAPPA